VVDARVDGRRVELTVADDGCGFDAAQAPGAADGHFGLQVMRTRAQALGGTLHVQATMTIIGREDV
jgi:signal transduction histidine kinase